MIYRIPRHKDFHQYASDIHQGELGAITFVAHAYDSDNAKRITDKLNELNEENITLKKELYPLKQFAEDNGINNINTAFSDCWNDNVELIEMNTEMNEDIKKLKGIIKKLNTDLKDERLKSWRLVNHLKLIGWNEEFIKSIMNNDMEILND